MHDKALTTSDDELELVVSSVKGKRKAPTKTQAAHAKRLKIIADVMDSTSCNEDMDVDVDVEGAF